MLSLVFPNLVTVRADDVALLDLFEEGLHRGCRRSVADVELLSRWVDMVEFKDVRRVLPQAVGTGVVETFELSDVVSCVVYEARRLRRRYRGWNTSYGVGTSGPNSRRLLSGLLSRSLASFLHAQAERQGKIRNIRGLKLGVFRRINSPLPYR